MQKNGKKINYDNELAYWRKANQVHKYLCDNGEVIEEEVEYIISKQVLKDLLEICKEIKEKAVLKEGQLFIGYKYENGQQIPMHRNGKYIENSEEIEAMLPTQSGFFFGSTAYDEYYMEDIEETIRQLEPVLNDLKEDEEIRYYASW